jgi:hypothetical protein
MKPRARRVTIAAAVLGAGVVAVLVVTHWATVRDHVEGWRFQLAKYTETIEPNSELTGRPINLRAEPTGQTGAHFIEAEALLECLANSSGLPVVFVPLHSETVIDAKDRFGVDFVHFSGDPPGLLAGWLQEMTAARAMATLEAFGCRVLEQRFPRRAYVVILDDHAAEENLRRLFESSFGLRHHE